MTDLLDDHLLGRLLARGPGALHGDRATDLASTGLWYYRLARAVLAPGAGAGQLSRRFAGVPVGARARLLAGAADLCTIYGMSTLAVEAARITAVSTTEGVQLNALSAEALAVAAHLGARVVVTARYPALEATAEHLGIEVRVLVVGER